MIHGIKSLILFLFPEMEGIVVSVTHPMYQYDNLVLIIPLNIIIMHLINVF